MVRAGRSASTSRRDSRLEIDGCTVGNMVQQGILVAGTGTVSIVNTTVIGNTGDRDPGGLAAALVTIVGKSRRIERRHGIAAEAGASATIEHDGRRRTACGASLCIGNIAGTRMAMTSSVVSDHPPGAGTYAEALKAGDVVAPRRHGSTLARNASGVQVDALAGGGTRRPASSTTRSSRTPPPGSRPGERRRRSRASRNGIFRNGVGFSAPGGASIYSPTTNYVRDNATDGTPVADSLL